MNYRGGQVLDSVPLCNLPTFGITFSHIINGIYRHLLREESKTCPADSSIYPNKMRGKSRKVRKSLVDRNVILVVVEGKNIVIIKVLYKYYINYIYK